MFYLIVLLLLLLAVATFAIQNSTVVIIQFFFWRFETSLVIVILGAAVAGAVAVGAFALTKEISSKLKLRDYQAKIRKLEEEVAAYKERQRGANGQAPGV